MIGAKTGYAEDSKDEEFEELHSQFMELEMLSKKLHDAAKKYKEAIACSFDIYGSHV